MSAGRRRRPRSHSARTASRAVIAPARRASPDERTAAARGLEPRQGLSPGGRRPLFAEEHSPGAGGRELLRLSGALVRRRRRIRIWKVDPGAYCTGARPPRFRLRAPRGTLAIRFAATRIARAARTYAN